MEDREYRNTLSISISKLYELEKKGREEAAKREEAPTEATVDLLYDMRDKSFRVALISSDLGDEEISRFANNLYYSSIALKYPAEECKDKNIPKKDCLISEEAINRLKLLDETSKRIIGKRCTWLLGVKEPYTLSSGINDITACFHRLIELVEEKAVEWKEEGKCEWRKDTDLDLIKTCKAWDAKTDELYQMRKMESWDYYPLKGKLKGYKGEFTVGSSVGHRTHIDLEEGSLTYYDRDLPVNRVMASLWEEHAKLKCEVGEEEVKCKGLTKENLRDALILLSYATSMDYRLNNPGGYWDAELLNKCERKCRMKDKDDKKVCIEKCAVEKFEGLR